MQDSEVNFFDSDGTILEEDVLAEYINDLYNRTSNVKVNVAKRQEDISDCKKYPHGIIECSNSGIFILFLVSSSASTLTILNTSNSVHVDNLAMDTWLTDVNHLQNESTLDDIILLPPPTSAGRHELP